MASLSKPQMRKNIKIGDIKNKSVKLRKSLTKTQSQKIAAEKDEKEHLIGANNLLAFSKEAVFRSLQNLYENSISDSSPSRSASESPTLSVSEVVELPERQLYSQNDRVHVPKTAETTSNNTTTAVSQAWSKFLKNYDIFRNFDITESKKDLIMKLVTRQDMPCPTSGSITAIKLKEYKDTIFKNNTFINTVTTIFFKYNYDTKKCKIVSKNREMRRKRMM